ncbi:MAG: ImmA/IrrE family metallo-endopeptidase [Candidatus Atribacteria bacterium]|nr:ImmA/IrrE family metallo-endopeptidase [Candidatus Atribacteria bacterium]
MNIEHNISRIKYLIKLYRITTEDFLIKISEGLKNPLTEKDVFGREIKISNLKRIDKLFNKGIEFYLNPKPINENKDASIFFRKDKFISELNIGAKKIVNKFEDLKISLNAISKLADIKIKRLIPIYNLTDNPVNVAEEIREKLYPEEANPNLRDFLKQLIAKFAEYNIFVFEFIETWNKKDTANINGFFLNPNVIVLKRQQKAFRREIFTLIHELGHYLLNEEEIEEVEVSSISKKDLTKIENWCNNFAYYFLIGDFKNTIDNIENATASNDYNFNLIEHISKETHLSTLALFTRLLYSGKISRTNYQNVKDDLDYKYQQKIDEEKKQKELDKLAGIKRGGSVPKPINSPLFVNTLQSALYGGIINEYDFCRQLNIKPDKIQQYI